MASLKFCSQSLEKNKKLIERNEELYIQGLSLHNAVEKFLGFQCGESLIDKNKGRNTDSNPPTPSSTDSSTSTPNDSVVQQAAAQSLPGTAPTIGNTGSNPPTPSSTDSSTLTPNDSVVQHAAQVNPRDGTTLQDKELQNVIGEAIEDLKDVTCVPNNNHKLNYTDRVNNRNTPSRGPGE